MIQFLKTKGIAILGVFLVMSMFLLSVIQRPLADTVVYYKLVVTSENYTSPYFNKGEGYSLYFDNETPISVHWLMDNPDYSVKVGSSYLMTIDFGNGYKMSGLTGKTLNRAYFEEILELEPTRWEGITKSRTAITLISDERDIFITAVSQGEALSPFQKVLKFVVSIGESLFALAGSTVTFIINHPIALFGLLIGLIYTGILIFRLMTKGV